MFPRLSTPQQSWICTKEEAIRKPLMDASVSRNTDPQTETQALLMDCSSKTFLLTFKFWPPEILYGYHILRILFYFVSTIFRLDFGIICPNWVESSLRAEAMFIFLLSFSSTSVFLKYFCLPSSTERPQ